MKKKALSLMMIFAILATSQLALMIQVPNAAAHTWQRMNWAPTQMFEFGWSGVLLRETRQGIQYWVITLVLIESMMPMELNSMEDSDIWVRMTLRWNPARQTGQILTFYHNGPNLKFTGWRGIIKANEGDGESFHYKISGLGIGSYGPNSRWGNLFIRGSLEGTYYPFLDENPSPFNSGWSDGYERATLLYFA